MEEKLTGTTDTNEIINLYSSRDAEVFAVPNQRFVVQFSNVTNNLKAGEKYKPARKPKGINAEESGYPDIEPYDTDNQLPQRLYKIIKSNNYLRNGLKNAAIELLGQGIFSGKTEINDKNESVFKFQDVSEWKDFAEKANVFMNYEVLAARNLNEYYMSFVSVIFNDDASKIVGIKARSPKDCRLSRAKNEQIDYCYYSRQWHNEPSIYDKERVVKLPVMDTWFLDFESIRKQVMSGPDREYIIILRVPTDDFPYSKPDWLAVVEQKYVELSNNVPIWKTAIMKNQTTFNQVIYFSEDYFRLKYPQWDMMWGKAMSGDKEAIKFVREKRELAVVKINDEMSGIENSGKLIQGNLLPNANNPHDKELRKSFILEALDNPKLDSKWVIDANEADKQIAYAVDIDTAAYSALPGATDTGGSNKREASNNSQLRKHIMETLLLFPYRFIIKYNQMGDFDVKVKRAMTPTLDMISAKERQTQQPQ